MIHDGCKIIVVTIFPTLNYVYMYVCMYVCMFTYAEDNLLKTISLCMYVCMYVKRGCVAVYGRVEGRVEGGNRCRGKRRLGHRIRHHGRTQR